MTTYLYVYFGAAYMALFLTPLVIWLARHINAMDRPGVRSVHENAIPRIGGVAIFIATMTVILIVLYLNNGVGELFRDYRTQIVTLLCSAAFIFVVGLVDDLVGLTARYKFLAQLAAAITLCIAGVRIDCISSANQWQCSLGAWGWILTVFWVVGITNAVNLSDGLDGLAGGIVAVACTVIAIFALNRQDIIMTIFMLALLGSLSGFLIFNFNPAKLFMGDCGSLFMGFIIASCSVMCVAKSTAIVGLALPALALGIPIFDTLFSMLRRFLERRSMFAPDRGHVHHRLLDLGLTQRRVVMVIHSATILVAGLGLFMLVQEDIGALVIFVCLLVVLLIMFRVVGAVRIREFLRRVSEKQEISSQKKKDRHTFEDLQLRFRRVENANQWWQAVCEAGQSMEFAWLSFKIVHPDGRVDVEVWRNTKTMSDHSKIVIMTIPLVELEPSSKREFSAAICIKNSLEDVGNRASLFGRLMDESDNYLNRG